MHPLLLKIGSFELFSYGLFMALGVLAGLAVLDQEAARNGWDRDRTTRFGVMVFVVGLLGSRLLYVFTRAFDPRVDLLAVAFNLRAGFVYYGGLIASWLYIVWTLRRYRLPFWPMSDAFAMAICIGLALGRFGCLLGGCCYGTPTSLPWGVVMAGEAHLGPLHPAQMYEGLPLIALFAALWLRRKHKRYAGESTVWFVGAYAVLRYVVEFWRGDSIRGFLIEDVLSTSQFLSLPLLAVAILIHLRLSKQGQGGTKKRR